MAEGMKCLKCGCEGSNKNGRIWGKQRYKCKKCHYQFTRETPRGHEASTKALALVLYLSGLSMNMTGKIVGVTAQSVMRWIKTFGKKTLSEFEFPTQVQEVELDEMHHFLLKKSAPFGSGRYWIITLDGCVGGNAVIVVPKP